MLGSSRADGNLSDRLVQQRGAWKQLSIGAVVQALPAHLTMRDQTWHVLARHRWVTGQDSLQEDSLWPTVYQGLDVYQEHYGAASPATPPPAASLVNPFSRGALSTYSSGLMLVRGPWEPCNIPSTWIRSTWIPRSVRGPFTSELH